MMYLLLYALTVIRHVMLHLVLTFGLINYMQAVLYAQIIDEILIIQVYST